MSDTEAVAASPETAESPTPPANELLKPDATAGEASFVEKVRSVASGIFSRRGISFRPGPGRPRKDGEPKISDVPLNAPTLDLPAGGPLVSPNGSAPLDTALVRRCIGAVSKGVFGFFDKIVFRKAMAAGESASQAQQLVSDTRPTEEELSGLTELAEICLRKHGVGTKYAPEIGLGAIVIGIGLRYGTAISTLNDEAKKKGQGGDK